MYDELFLEHLEREIAHVIEVALQEDLDKAGDITSLAVIDETERASAEIIAKTDGVIAGLAIAGRVFRQLDADVDYRPIVNDGDKVRSGTVIAAVNGSARAMLAAERTALNILQHLSGIATDARRFIDAVAGYDVKVLDTRKTTPGLRYLEKYAANIGGVTNHRLGLFDQILIKDNHIDYAGGMIAAVEKARRRYPDKLIEIEAETLEHVGDALAAGSDIILLDNMEPELLSQAVELVAGRATTEASGGVGLHNIASIAATGVDRISVGAITQAARPLDISMEVVPDIARDDR